MSTHRTIPQYIDAFQWKMDLTTNDVPQWYVDARTDKRITGRSDGSLAIATPGQIVIANHGDWVIRVRPKVLFAMRDEDFVRQYEPVNVFTMDT
jgi:hypothetical protein